MCICITGTFLFTSGKNATFPVKTNGNSYLHCLADLRKYIDLLNTFESEKLE